MSTWDEDSFRGDVGDAMLGAIVVAGGAGAPMPIDAVGRSGGRRRDRGGGGIRRRGLTIVGCLASSSSSRRGQARGASHRRGGEFDDEDWRYSAAARSRLRCDEDEPGEPLITSIVLESSTIASTMYVKVWIGDGEDW